MTCLVQTHNCFTKNSMMFDVWFHTSKCFIWCHFLKHFGWKSATTIAIASAHNVFSQPDFNNIDLAVSTIILLTRSATPFCWGRVWHCQLTIPIILLPVWHSAISSNILNLPRASSLRFEEIHKYASRFIANKCNKIFWTPKRVRIKLAI